MSCLQYLVDRVSSVLDNRASGAPDVAAAGMVINTMGYIDGLGFELLIHAIKSLKVRFIVQCRSIFRRVWPLCVIVTT